MALVDNNVVKMEWEKSGFLTKKQGKATAFYVATKMYKSSKLGNIPVFFDPFMAYVWRDAGTKYDLWSVSDLKGFIKESYDSGFPTSYTDNCVPVVHYGEEEVDQEMLEELGLTEYADDILARIQDLAPYGEEKEVTELF